MDLIRVVLLPYSDAQSLPESIPQHLKKNALKLPGDFNQLVSDVHHVGRKPLFDFLPFKFIQPEVKLSRKNLTWTDHPVKRRLFPSDILK